MNILALIFLFLISSSLQAQKVFTVDTLNNKVSSLPFDQTFIIKVKDPQKSIDLVSVWPLFVRKGQLVDKVFLRKSEELFHFKPTKYLDGYTYLEFQALGPDQHFEVILDHKFRGKAFESLLEVFTYFNGNSQYRFDSLHRLSEELEPPIVNGRPRTAIGKYWLANGSYRNEMDRFFAQKIKTPFAEAIDLSNTSSVPTSNLIETSLRKLNTEYKKIDKKFNGFSVFNSIYNHGNFNVIFTGESSITMTLSKVNPHQLTLRVKNLESSIKKMNEFLRCTYEVLLMDNLNSSTYNSMIVDFQSIRTQLIKNKNYIKNKIEAISLELDNEKNMRYTTWFSGTNEVRDLKTKGSYFLIPNIGVTQLFTPEDQNNFTKPFVGVSFHLRQVDKSIPLRELRNSLLHRLAIQIGLTVSEIKDNNNEYFDLMNKMSLMTGINVKVHRAFGVSGGAVFMKRADPNPLISDRQTVANFYLALTIDVDFANSLKSITGKFGL